MSVPRAEGLAEFPFDHTGDDESGQSEGVTVGKQFDSVLILMVAVCTVLGTSVTIHDANAGKANPIVHEVSAGLRGMVSWFGAHSANPSGKTSHGAGKNESTVVPSATGTVKKLEQSLFGPNALVPTVGAVLP